MIRKNRHLLLPAIAAALLSGCVTYGYRGGQGDYYYGQPTTEYVDPYGYGGYGYGGYGYGYPGYGYPGYYGAPYWSGSFGYYGHYYPYRPRPPHNNGGQGGGNGNHGNHGNGNGQPPPQSRPDRPRPPWRDLNGIGRPNQAKPSDRPEPQPSFRPTPVRPATRPPRQIVAPAQVRMAPQRMEPVEPGAPVRRAGNPKRDVRRIPIP